MGHFLAELYVLLASFQTRSMLSSAGVRTESLCPAIQIKCWRSDFLSSVFRNVISNQEYQKRATLEFEVSLHLHPIRLRIVNI